MVRGNHLKLVTAAADDRVDAWAGALTEGVAQADGELVRQALAWIAQGSAAKTLRGGEPLPEHAVATALILRDFKLDTECIAASLLAHVAENSAAMVEIRDRFGARIAELAEGVARMAMIEELSSRSAQGAGQ